jgi:hypothetical protein
MLSNHESAEQSVRVEMQTLADCPLVVNEILFPQDDPPSDGLPGSAPSIAQAAVVETKPTVLSRLKTPEVGSMIILYGCLLSDTVPPEATDLESYDKSYVITILQFSYYVWIIWPLIIAVWHQGTLIVYVAQHKEFWHR